MFESLLEYPELDYTQVQASGRVLPVALLHNTERDSDFDLVDLQLATLIQ